MYVLLVNELFSFLFANIDSISRTTQHIAKKYSFLCCITYFMTIGSILDQQPDKLKGSQKFCKWHSAFLNFVYTPHYNGRKGIFAPLFCFQSFCLHSALFYATSLIISRLCCADKTKELLHCAYTHLPPTCTHLHASALTPYRTRLTTKTGVPPAHYGIGGADFLSEQQIFLPPYTFFSDWHKRYDTPGTSTSADGSADKIRLCLHCFSH